MRSLNKKNIDDIEVAGKRVLVRCDFNVPLQGGVITNDARIRAAIPTILSLQKRGARIILCSHLGRPNGVVSPEFSLRPVADALGALLGSPVPLAKDIVGPDAADKAAALQDGEVMLLENVRFCKEETKNDPAFAKKLADLADIYVNDAFGTAHRAHASTAGVTAFLPSVCGYLIEREIRVMGSALETPEHPFVAVLGGAKVSDKIGVIRNFLGKVDILLIGGGMSYTFMKVKGLEIGNSLVEEDKLPLAQELLDEAKRRGVELCLPVDYLAGDRFSADCEVQVVTEIPDGWMGMDIGPATRVLYADLLKTAKTVIWNGPMGVFEFDSFALGTFSIAKAIADSDAVSIIGGGDSAAAIEKLGYADQMTHISTGGGATLEFLEGLELPGIAALDDQ